MTLAIVKYNSGNVRSVDFALQRLGVYAVVTDDFDTLRSADKILFPGVGHVGAAMRSLREKKLDLLLPSLRQPFLGICAGMQLLCSHSEEGDTDCLGIIPMQVKRFPDQAGLKIPHTGWDEISQLKGPLFAGIAERSYMYFVHSYCAETGDYTMAQCDYGHPFSAALQKDNFYGVQFHTELSAAAGSAILSNFLNLRS